MATTGLNSAQCPPVKNIPSRFLCCGCMFLVGPTVTLCFLSILNVSHIKQAHNEIFYPQCLTCVLHTDSVRGVLHTYKSSPTGQLFNNALQELIQVRKGKTDARATRGGNLSSRRAAWHESRTNCETARASSSNTEEDKTIRSSLMTHQDLDGTHHPALLPIVTAETAGCNPRQQLGSASKIRREGKTMCGL